MSKAYGLFEVTGVVAAVDALDIMCKTADVTLATWERRLGGRLVTLIVEGDVSACTEAIEAASSKCIKQPVSTGIIANPHPETGRLVEFSSQRWKKKYEESLRREAERAKADAEAGTEDDSYLHTV